MNSRKRETFFNYTGKFPILKRLKNEVIFPDQNTLILINDPAQLNGQAYSKELYLCQNQQPLQLMGEVLSISFPDSQPFDISGPFGAIVDNGDQKDVLFHTSHTLLIGNEITITDSDKITVLKKRGAFSKHLKAELVEFSENTWVPPHCHGTATYKADFIAKYQSSLPIYDMQDMPEKYPHPQLIFVLEGDGVFYTDLETTPLKAGDTIIYGSHTIHMAKSGPNGMKYIHFVWSQK